MEGEPPVDVGNVVDIEIPTSVTPERMELVGMQITGMAITQLARGVKSGSANIFLPLLNPAKILEPYIGEKLNSSLEMSGYKTTDEFVVGSIIKTLRTVETKPVPMEGPGKKISTDFQLLKDAGYNIETITKLLCQHFSLPLEDFLKPEEQQNATLPEDSPRGKKLLEEIKDLQIRFPETDYEQIVRAAEYRIISNNMLPQAEETPTITSLTAEMRSKDPNVMPVEMAKRISEILGIPVTRHSVSGALDKLKKKRRLS